MSYRLTCECGRAYPIETRQSGQTFQCECGKTLQIPTMLKMKRLPLWEESASSLDEAPNGSSASSVNSPANSKDSVASGSVASGSVASDSVASDSVASETRDVAPSSKQSSNKPSIINADSSASQANKPTNKSTCNKLSSKRFGLLVVAGLVFVVSVFFFCRNVPTPNPRAVFYKQTTFSLDDGRKIKRDSTPITESDFYFYYFTDFSAPNRPTYPVSDELIDAMVPFIAYQYFNYVRDLNLSDNFYENYDAIKTKRVLSLYGFGIVALIALAIALYAIFAKESVKQVGTMRGSDWR